MVGRLAVVSGVSLRAAREAPRFKIQHEPDTNNDNARQKKNPLIQNKRCHNLRWSNIE